MSLGVLNNISAMYAENNLNNTTNSLNTVLQQLSSGSKINSGADDAAGLSLVNGLQANSQALAQSQTNAQEGVGLLQVADGALSQVTSLLNRAVTLATEASNGTLNASQDTAANQEYQSILSEVSNIGSTTTYNGNSVFGSKTNIYTGDSSTAGAAVNDLNIRSLSSSNVGDSSGNMAYSNGSNNVFVDLSSGGTNAAATDSLGKATATTTLAVSYMTKGANGSAVSATANVSVGAGTSYANTAQGLISAINGAGLGVTASFGTAAQAGTASTSAATAANAVGGGSSDTGIIISGAGVGTGSSSAGQIGTLTTGLVSGTTETLTSGTLSITGSDGTSHNITLGTANSTDNLTDLASTINAAGYGVTASVNTNYLDGHATGTVLTFTSASSSAAVTASNLVDGDTGHTTTDIALSATPAASGSTFTNQIGTVTTSAANATYLSGVLAFGSSAATITLGTAGTTDNAADLAATVNKGNYGVTAAVNTVAETIGGTSYAAGEVVSFDSANAADTFSATTAVTTSGTATSSVNVANQNQIGGIGVGLVAAHTSGGGATDSVGGNIVINGTTITVTAAASGLATMATDINASNLGVTASLNTASQVVDGNTFAAGTYLTMVSNNSSTQGATFTSTLADTTSVGTQKDQDTPSATSTSFYSTGVTGSVADSTTGGGTANTALVANNNGSNGVATISYSDAAGASLSSTDLSTATEAQAALTTLNAAITDVSAQDGYIGAQINQLNAVSSVLSTQQENVTSAQNAVQATDYASATSNMSKYEILSQTGISALAQANSMSQEVTKLLQ